MNGLPYYKAYPRDFIEGTIGMPFEVKCAYRVVLDLIYMQGGNLPDDARYISGLLGCSIRKWKSIREALLDADKIQVSGEFLTNYRAEKELETLAKLQDQQRENRSRPNKNNNLKSPKADHTEPEPDIEDTNVSSIGDFDAFWDVVPRKIGKGQARTAYRRAIKKTDPQTILSAMRTYAAERRGKDQQFTAHPATWLNGERWEDEPQQETRNGRRDGEAAAMAQRVAERFSAKNGMDRGPDSDAVIPLLPARHSG